MQGGFRETGIKVMKVALVVVVVYIGALIFTSNYAAKPQVMAALGLGKKSLIYSGGGLTVELDLSSGSQHYYIENWRGQITTGTWHEDGDKFALPVESTVNTRDGLPVMIYVEPDANDPKIAHYWRRDEPDEKILLKLKE